MKNTNKCDFDRRKLDNFISLTSNCIFLGRKCFQLKMNIVVMIAKTGTEE